MDKSEIQERIVKVVCEVLNVTPEMVTPESDFIFDLGAESSQSVQLVAGFDEEFGIDMDAEDALSIQTVGDAVAFIEKYVNK